MSQKEINEHCIKCNCNVADFKYIGEGIAINKRIDGEFIILSNKAKSEIILLTCRRCGYQWAVTPLDSN